MGTRAPHGITATRRTGRHLCQLRARGSRLRGAPRRRAGGLRLACVVGSRDRRRRRLRRPDRIESRGGAGGDRAVVGAVGPVRVREGRGRPRPRGVEAAARTHRGRGAAARLRPDSDLRSDRLRHLRPRVRFARRSTRPRTRKGRSRAGGAAEAETCCPGFFAALLCGSASPHWRPWRSSRCSGAVLAREALHRSVRAHGYRCSAAAGRQHRAGDHPADTGHRPLRQQRPSLPLPGRSRTHV